MFEVRPFKNTCGKFAFNEKRHLSSVRPNAMPTYTSNRTSLQRNAVIRHTHAADSHTLYT